MRRYLYFWSDQRHGREIVAITPRIAREQWQRFDGGMGADKDSDNAPVRVPHTGTVLEIGFAARKSADRGVGAMSTLKSRSIESTDSADVNRVEISA